MNQIVGELVEAWANYDTDNIGLWRLAIVISERLEGYYVDILLANGRKTVVHQANIRRFNQ